MEHENELLALLEALREFERQFGLGSRFNLFEAVNMVRQEIRHSRLLAFLLNPSETHGLGDKFLRAVLTRTAAAHPKPPLSKLTLAVTDCSDALVYCERDHFDITVQLPSLRLMFVIENKIGAAESDDQLTNYRQLAQSRYPDYRFMGTFLTPDGYAGEDEHWGTLSYGAIAVELKRLLTTETLQPAVALTIQHYVELIERRIVVSDELINACRRIYAEHRVALDLVAEHGFVPVLGEAFTRMQEKRPTLSKFKSRTNEIFFVDTSWKQLSGFQVAEARWGVSCPVQYWLLCDGAKLILILEVGPVRQDTGFDRQGFVEALRKSLPIKGGRQTIKASYSRVLRAEEAVSADAGVDQIHEAIEALWSRIHGDVVTSRVAQAAKDCMSAGNTPAVASAAPAAGTSPLAQKKPVEDDEMAESA
ncbi:PD-(D/E)XK nuclease family protein [Caldimonas tepidiphila]|uniref:PDDEXK-like family protein n=1 Tax=Caldimonas tepidiphila TaxID=2315841 RepID=UPI000E5B5891|nr:PD-(D/E)XK nuclease family protein [Caldimonas tepidiphila]